MGMDGNYTTSIAIFRHLTKWQKGLTLNQACHFTYFVSVQKSWDEHLTRAEVLLWFKQLLSEFDLFLITEDMDRSLAFAHLEFGIPIDDLLNVAVNQANDYHAKPTISPTTKVNLR